MKDQILHEEDRSDAGLGYATMTSKTNKQY